MIHYRNVLRALMMYQEERKMIEGNASECGEDYSRRSTEHE